MVMFACAICQRLDVMRTKGPDDVTWFCLPCLRTWFRDFL
jgi:hypothetical protein